MKHQDLKDQITGSFLKKQYLEAFAIQSAYIEGLIKLHFDMKYLVSVASISDPPPFLLRMKRDFDKAPISKILTILKDSGNLSQENFELIQRYQRKRNETLHQLLDQFHAVDFEKTLEETYKLGKQIMEAGIFQSMQQVVDWMEESRIGPIDPRTSGENSSDGNKEASKV
jgi:hypothetical protein